MRQILSYITLFFLISHTAKAEDYKNNIPPKVRNYITILEAKEHELQGGAIAIIYKGEVVYKKAFGHAHENTGPINSSTLFPLASVSKIVTSLAVALMLDKNELDLNKEYQLPYLKSKVTIKNILGNTTGYRFSGNQDIEKGMPRKELLAKLKKLPQPCKPGQCYFYSNLCFSLISDILEINKVSLKTAIKKLTDSLGTNEITLPPLPKDVQVAFPHIIHKKTNNFVALPFPVYYPAAVPAAAGIFASIDGMIELYKLRFGYRPDLISDKTLELFNTPYIKADIKHWKLPYEDEIESYYSLSWRIFKSKAHKNKDLIFHSGWIAGINTFIGAIPEEAVGIIVLTNQKPPAAARTGLNFWRDILG